MDMKTGNSGTTTTLSPTDIPGHDNMIITSAAPNDWRNPKNDNLWQGVTGINNPCPAGFRIPTEEEWETERQTWSSNDHIGAFNSYLKLPRAGRREWDDGELVWEGIYGYCWSSTVDGTSAKRLHWGSGICGWDSPDRAVPYSVRCIKTQPPTDPIPLDGSTDVGINTDITWTCTNPNDYKYNVYFGINANPPLVADSLTAATYDPGTLDYSTTYYWKVTAFDNYGNSAISDVWNFTTVCDPMPTVANAGPDQWLMSVTETYLNANTPEYGTGIWSYVDSSSIYYWQLADPYDPNSHISGSLWSDNQLKWTISNECGSTSDVVYIEFLDWDDWDKK